MSEDFVIPYYKKSSCLAGIVVPNTDGPWLKFFEIIVRPMKTFYIYSPMLSLSTFFFPPTKKMPLFCLFPINCPSMRGNPLQHLPLDHQTLLHGVDLGQGLIMIWITGNHRFVTSRFDTSIQFSTLWCFSLFPCVPLICIFDATIFGLPWQLHCVFSYFIFSCKCWKYQTYTLANTSEEVCQFMPPNPCCKLIEKSEKNEW